MVSAVIFDMDGVLVDSHCIHKQAWRRLMQSLGHPVTDQQLEFVLDGRKRDDILQFFLGELSEFDLREYGLKKDKLFAECASELQLVDGVREFIAALANAGVLLAVGSSASRPRAERILEQFGLTRCFSAIVTGNDVTTGKPDPAVFTMACQRLRGDPATSLVVEDAVSGVKGARAAGMKCMGIADGERAQLLYEAGAHYVVPNFVGLEVDTLFHLIERAPDFDAGPPPTGLPLGLL
jgi:HAD superfamily hydrolase (TIGR01509 family)